jgi:hypothetical protein
MSISGRRSRQRGLQLSLANAMPSWLVICTAGAVLGVRSRMRAARTRGDGVVAADLGASSGEVGDRFAVGPVGHRQREQAAHRRLVMVWEVRVRVSRRHRTGADQGERGERALMVEGGDLGDHPADADADADADAGEVRRPSAEGVDEGRGVSGEVPERIRGSLRVRRCRLAAVT